MTSEAQSPMENKKAIVRHELTSPAMMEELRKALPSHVDLEQFVRVAISCLTPDILACERTSVFSSIFSAAQLGLMPEPFLGQCYLVPYKGKAQLQIGYKGLIALARRSGDVKTIDSGVIYEKDKVVYKKGIVTELEIVPYLDGDPGVAKLVYCVIHLGNSAGGGHQIEIMRLSDVENIRKSSPSANSPAWKSHWDQMARKVCIKRALNYAPLSVDVQRGIAVDSGAKIDARGELTGEFIQLDDGTQISADNKGSNGSGSSRLDKLKETAGAAPPKAARAPRKAKDVTPPKGEPSQPQNQEAYPGPKVEGVPARDQIEETPGWHRDDPGYGPITVDEDGNPIGGTML